MAALTTLGLAACTTNAGAIAGPSTSSDSTTALIAGRPGPGTYPVGPCRYRKGTAGTPFASQALPDPTCTNGAFNPAVTQSDIGSTICASGWTSSIRPSEAYTEPLKRRSLAAYGQHGPLSAYEFDHLVPLELGGAPSDPRNLWPEPDNHPSSYYVNSKDEVENVLNRAVCDRTVGLAAARSAIATNWETAETTLGVKP